MHQTVVTNGEGISEELVWLLVREHRQRIRPALERLWDYYRNALDFGEADERRPYTAAQQQGLPWRLTRGAGGAAPRFDVGGGRREVVIENDIAWRIHTLVDFMFGRPIRVESLAPDAERAGLIERVLAGVFEANGGVCFFQDMALLGSVYGFVDVLVRAEGLFGDVEEAGEQEGSGTGRSPADRVPSKAEDAERAVRRASRMVLETVEAPRAIPVLDPCDYRRLVGYIVHYTRVLNRVDRGSFLTRLVDGRGRGGGRQATVEVMEVWTAQRRAVYHDGRLVEEAAHAAGRVPVAHIQNLPQPLFYEGLSEVEPLIPLQDELNTRLSDRANRVTMQSFKMYLGKGIERFTERPIGPGQMWMTDNPAATIEQFGGDGHSPSEEAHIGEVRDALDKTSGVTPVAAGLLRDKVGNLTSENALRIVLIGLLAKTERKRVTYGRGIERIAELALAALDVAGVLRTRAEERRVRLHWPSPLPENDLQRLEEAERKLRIGVPARRVLAELGYGVES